jgi:hypothetical protein
LYWLFFIGIPMKENASSTTSPLLYTLGDVAEILVNRLSVLPALQRLYL